MFSISSKIMWVEEEGTKKWGKMLGGGTIKNRSVAYQSAESSNGSCWYNYRHLLNAMSECRGSRSERYIWMPNYDKNVKDEWHPWPKSLRIPMFF